MCSTENDAKPKGGSGRRSTKGKQRPAYKRRVKPPYSYVELITMAIKSAPSQMKTLREILDFMQTKFVCFRGSYVGWKNSVRHNLSAAECFIKVLRNEQRPYGKDNYWMLNADCTHCYNNATGGRSGGSQNKRRKMSGASGCTNGDSMRMATAPITLSGYHDSSYQHHQSIPNSPSMADFDAGFSDSNSVHQWVVANQALSPRVTHAPGSNPSEAPMQYIELRHTNSYPSSHHNQHRDVSKFDFSLSVSRVSCRYAEAQSNSEKLAPHTVYNSRAQSSSSAAESTATYSSGFESSCSEPFDLEPVGDDHLNMIVDDLFVPEDDLDLSLYEDWPAAQATKMATRTEGTRENSDEVYFALASPPSRSPSCSSHPPSPHSVAGSSVCPSEIRTSNTPPQPQYFKQESHPPPSPMEHCYYDNNNTSTQEFYHGSRIAALPRSQYHPQSSQFQPQFQSFNNTASSPGHSVNDWISSEVWMQCSDAPSSNNSSPRSSPVPTSSTTAATPPPSLPHPENIPTFESMLTSAVRDSLNIDTVKETAH